MTRMTAQARVNYEFNSRFELAMDDFLVEPTKQNAEKILTALRDFIANYRVET